MLAAFHDLVASRRGHFQLESGHHSDLWLDLDALFAAPRRIMPFIDALSDALRAHDIAVVCGPLLGGAFVAQLVAHRLDVEFCFTERDMPANGDGLFQSRYTLPAAFIPRVAGRRVAMVDDVMSAGSALRGTFAELRAHASIPVVAGALLVLGDTGTQFFAEQALPVEAVARDDFATWLPAECPLCASRVPLARPASAG